MILGGLLFVSGLLKWQDNFHSISMGIGVIHINIPNNMSAFYIIVVNWLGGAAMFWHGFSTLKFQKSIITDYQSALQSSPEVKPAINNMSRLDFASGIVTIIIAIWCGVRVAVLLAGFDRPEEEFLLFIPIVILLYAPFCVVPLILVARNFSLSNKVGEIIENNRRAEIRTSHQSNPSTRTRRR